MRRRWRWLWRRGLCTPPLATGCCLMLAKNCTHQSVLWLVMSTRPTLCLLALYVPPCSIQTKLCPYGPIFILDTLFNSPPSCEATRTRIQDEAEEPLQSVIAGTSSLSLGDVSGRQGRLGFIYVLFSSHLIVCFCSY